MHEFMDKWLYYFKGIIWPSIGETIRMATITGTFTLIFGFLFGVLLTLYGPNGLNPKKNRYKILSFVVNSVRSFPVIILIVAISPLTRLIMGTTIGEKAAIFPLTIASAPFISKVVENSLNEVHKSIIEAAKSCGASNKQIMLGVIVKEAVPSLISGLTLASINILTLTTLAGAVGAGGIGAVALSYGYQSFNNIVLYTSVFILLILVSLVQAIGNNLYNRIK